MVAGSSLNDVFDFRKSFVWVCILSWPRQFIAIELVNVGRAPIS